MASRPAAAAALVGLSVAVAAFAATDALAVSAPTASGPVVLAVIGIVALLGGAIAGARWLRSGDQTPRRRP